MPLVVNPGPTVSKSQGSGAEESDFAKNQLKGPRGRSTVGIVREPISSAESGTTSMDLGCERCKSLANLFSRYDLMYTQLGEQDSLDATKKRVYDQVAEMREAARLLLQRHMEREHGCRDKQTPLRE